MRELNTTELESVSGGVMQCTPEEMGTLWGINVTEHIGTAFINIYEGLIEATSYMIERVATSFN
jgi:bacteriocin-like protein